MYRFLVGLAACILFYCYMASCTGICIMLIFSMLKYIFSKAISMILLQEIFFKHSTCKMLCILLDVFTHSISFKACSR